MREKKSKKRPKVKICGITNVSDALAAAGAGCDAVGFIFYKKSPRCVSEVKAREIIRCLPGGVKKVGVFVNARLKTLKRIAEFCGLDYLQLHGNESVLFCKSCAGYPVIKAFRIKDSLNVKHILKYKTWGYLFDTFEKSRAGGTGRSFDWCLLKDLKVAGNKVFLSGGLNERNLNKALRCVHPDWVDACSSVEKIPGKKDHRKIRRFIRAVKKTM